MQKVFGNKVLSILLATSLVIGTTSIMTACGFEKNETVTLTVFSQLANSEGMQTGWAAKVLKNKFNVKLNIVPHSDKELETRIENKNLGDMVVWANDGDQYSQAVKEGLLYSWQKDNLLTGYGSYIKDNMQSALQRNREITSIITNGDSNKLYGYGFNVATTNRDHESFMYTWDLRWDLYKKLGCPKVKDLNDYEKMLVAMQKLEPTDDNGKKKYAVSLWTGWDDAMVMYVKAMATAYYGYDELGLGLYDPQTGNYHDALEKNGPYIKMLQFFNRLYRDGLIDPASKKQSYEHMSQKVRNGGTLFSIFNFAGSQAYNKDEHLSKGKIMTSMKPEKAEPIVYGMNTQGGNRIWSIGSKTEYPELCMQIINYLSTPEGFLTMKYGPKGDCWYYKNNKTHFTKLGASCWKNVNTEMGAKYEGTFKDGELQINNTTWSIDAANPETDGETYNCNNWESNKKKVSSKIEQMWQKETGCKTVDEYMENGRYILAPGTTYTPTMKSDKLKKIWKQVTYYVKKYSWNAIYANNDAEFAKQVENMRYGAKTRQYEKCLEWSLNEAAIRKSLEDKVVE